MTDTEVPEVMSEYRRDQVAQRNTRPQLFDETDLRNIKSFDDIANLVKERELAASRASDLGHGFVLLEDKAALVKKELMILDWRYYPSTKGRHKEFVTLQIVTKDGGKWIVNDGSTGIYEQCKLWDLAEVVLPMYVPKGLRVSQYKYTDAKTGDESDAETYYISTDA